jgi:hypothetical protein
MHTLRSKKAKVEAVPVNERKVEADYDTGPGVQQLPADPQPAAAAQSSHTKESYAEFLTASILMLLITLLDLTSHYHPPRWSFVLLITYAFVCAVNNLPPERLQEFFAAASANAGGPILLF